MDSKTFSRKFFSSYLWGNIFAIFIVVALLAIGVKYGIDIYTHHGESIVVPNVVHKQFDAAKQIMDERGLTIEVSDTGYDKRLPPDCILEQTPIGGKRVKSTHIIYVTINAASAPMLVIPDIIDNSSLREAQARLLAMGFKVGDPQYISGEKDWVYGVIVNGHHVQAGDRVPADAVIIIQVGDGMRSDVDTMFMEEQEPEYGYVEEPIEPEPDEDDYSDEEDNSDDEYPMPENGNTPKENTAPPATSTETNKQ